MASSSSAIQEGLICAECHAQFNSVEILLKHYETLHSGGEGSSASSNSIKNLIDKAKKLRFKGSEGGGDSGSGIPTYFDVWDELNGPGKITTHTLEFKKIRLAGVERSSAESSKLLIRLHKLMSWNSKGEKDEAKRKNFEQEIVPWIDPKIVSRCPDCTVSFGLLSRRKHHCRLCGSVLCEACCWWISSELGAGLTGFLGPPLGTTHCELSAAPVVPAAEYSIRTCGYCYSLVTSANLTNQGSESGTGKPIITQFYDKLQSLMTSAEKLKAELSLVRSSLERGENLYSIEQATTLRNEALQLTERIDNLSKKIVLLGSEAGAGEVLSSSEVKLRSRIRLGTISWIREFISYGLGAGGGPGPGTSDFTQGWTPSLQASAESVSETDDPFSIQVGNLKKWIAEAKKAKRQEEVELLEANLKELLELSSSASSTSISLFNAFK